MHRSIKYDCASVSFWKLVPFRVLHGMKRVVIWGRLFAFKQQIAGTPIFYARLNTDGPVAFRRRVRRFSLFARKKRRNIIFFQEFLFWRCVFELRPKATNDMSAVFCKPKFTPIKSLTYNKPARLIACVKILLFLLWNLLFLCLGVIHS